MKNKSTTYLFPLINDILNIDFEFFKNYITNTYVFSNKYENNYFYLEIDFDFKIPEFIEEEERLRNFDIYIDSIDLNEDKVLYVYEFPKSYIYEYNKYLEGKYSEFKIDAKTKILKFYNKLFGVNEVGINKLNNIKYVLFKDKILKQKLEEKLNVSLPDNAELSSILDIDEETILL